MEKISPTGISCITSAFPKFSLLVWWRRWVLVGWDSNPLVSMLYRLECPVLLGSVVLAFSQALSSFFWNRLHTCEQSETKRDEQFVWTTVWYVPMPLFFVYPRRVTVLKNCLVSLCLKKSESLRKNCNIWIVWIGMIGVFSEKNWFLNSYGLWFKLGESVQLWVWIPPVSLVTRPLVWMNSTSRGSPPD